MINNIKHKYTTGAAIIILIYVVLKIFGIDIAEKLNMPFEEMTEVIGGAITALILALSRDPKDNKNDKQD